MQQHLFITNSQYPGRDAALFMLTGPLVGYHQDGSANPKWEVVLVGANQITLKNVATGTYASVPHEAQNTPVLGSSDPYTWQQLCVPGGWYQIATTDGAFVWRLMGDYDGGPIMLQETPYTGKDTQWGYNPAI